MTLKVQSIQVLERSKDSTQASEDGQHALAVQEASYLHQCAATTVQLHAIRTVTPQSQMTFRLQRKTLNGQMVFCLQ